MSSTCAAHLQTSPTLQGTSLQARKKAQQLRQRFPDTKALCCAQGIAPTPGLSRQISPSEDATTELQSLWTVQETHVGRPGPHRFHTLGSTFSVQGVVRDSWGLPLFLYANEHPFLVASQVTPTWPQGWEDASTFSPKLQPWLPRQHQPKRDPCIPPRGMSDPQRTQGHRAKLGLSIILTSSHKDFSSLLSPQALSSPTLRLALWFLATADLPRKVFQHETDSHWLYLSNTHFQQNHFI